MGRRKNCQKQRVSGGDAELGEETLLFFPKPHARHRRERPSPPEAVPCFCHFSHFELPTPVLEWSGVEGDQDRVRSEKSGITSGPKA